MKQVLALSREYDIHKGLLEAATPQALRKPWISEIV
jgi:hypothetical protein